MSTREPKILDDLIRKNARKNPGKRATLFEGRSIGYGAFYDDIDRAARMLLGNARIQVATKEISSETILPASTAVGYIAGLSGIAMPAFHMGCTLVLEVKLQADKLLQAIEYYHVDTTLMLPTMLLEMLSEITDLSTLKACNDDLCGNGTTFIHAPAAQARVG